ncbi:phosphoesterase [Bacillus sp. LL01]|uniref:phosphatase PAP2 family protein n=1 Tax=Bacillus sp. LL01 TaxID=1665556 RepID=UPI00064D4B97|nr:phosphatase PAP2 family protein [Bacillus sp. LL01]KMJ57745.1 phosphoesterase [Bacillus sp. LL01]
MVKLLANFYEFECNLFRSVNRHFDRKYVNFFFRNITHVGGATFTICTLLLLIIFSNHSLKYTAMAAGLSLALSHIPVAIAKKVYPRRRPYLALDEIKVSTNPLKDHSFPSGHTTAVFSSIIPFILLMPSLAILLIPLALCVGISRIYLGLHYPSDIAVGMLLGTSTSVLSYMMFVWLFL